MQTALPILMYHHVSPNSGLVTVSPDTFKAQIKVLAKEGWHTIGTEQLESFYAGEHLPKKSLMITFDDGYLDNWTYAFPILQKLSVKATVYLVT